ncbi:hypothetical protein NHG32_02475 [Aerococcaceae bacterium NML191219]|nr:hypothetical protein [Aerococcaceae bacterium NML191219]
MKITISPGWANLREGTSFAVLVDDRLFRVDFVKTGETGHIAILGIKEVEAYITRQLPDDEDALRLVKNWCLFQSAILANAGKIDVVAM